MTDFSISGLMRSPSVDLSFDYCLHVTTDKWHRLISFHYMHLALNPALHTQCHTCSTCSVNQVTFPALIQFNGWVIPTFPFTHCIQCKRTNAADLTSKYLWSQSGRIRHGRARGPRNSSPKIAPNHHTTLGHCNRTSTSVTGLYSVMVFHSFKHAEIIFPGQGHGGRGSMRAAFLGG